MRLQHQSVGLNPSYNFLISRPTFLTFSPRVITDLKCRSLIESLSSFALYKNSCFVFPPTTGTPVTCYVILVISGEQKKEKEKNNTKKLNLEWRVGTQKKFVVSCIFWPKIKQSQAKISLSFSFLVYSTQKNSCGFLNILIIIY